MFPVPSLRNRRGFCTVVRPKLSWLLFCRDRRRPDRFVPLAFRHCFIAILTLFTGLRFGLRLPPWLSGKRSISFSRPPSPSISLEILRDSDFFEFLAAQPLVRESELSSRLVQVLQSP